MDLAKEILFIFFAKHGRGMEIEHWKGQKEKSEFRDERGCKKGDVGGTGKEGKRTGGEERTIEFLWEVSQFSWTMGVQSSTD